jgi:predicted AAA+ superfamily ATPase
MQKSEIKPLLLSQQSIFQNSSNLVPRVSFIFQGGSGITFIFGPRHAGKTSLLRQMASKLQGVKIYIDFEDCRLRELGSEVFQILDDILAENDTLAKIYEKESGSNEAAQTYYFLDEIHNFPGWDSWIDRLFRQGAGVFVTSSTASVTEQELSTRFAGRSKLLKLFPFSFKEYLLMKYSVIPKPNSITPSLSDELLCALLKYFENGGFPEVIRTGNVKLCQTYFEEILQKGDSAGYNIQNITKLKKLAQFLISNMACEYSFETLKAVSGVENEETVRRYLDYLEDNFLIYRIPKLDCHSESKEKSDTPHKVYAADTGFFKAVYPNYPDSLGLRFENLILLELLRREKQVFYFQNRKECDFLIKEEDSQKVSAAIQASIYFGSQAVKERELLGLMEAMEEYGLEEGLILTLDDEEVLRIKGKDGNKKIIVKPAWKWMLE